MYEEISISVEQASDAKVLIISVAARLAGMHPQTLRQYDRLGLVQPGRAGGGGRRYSERDVALLREVQKLSQDEGVNLAGIKRIIGLEQLVGRPAAAGRRAGAAARTTAYQRIAQLRSRRAVPGQRPGPAGTPVDGPGGVAAAPPSDSDAIAAGGPQRRPNRPRRRGWRTRPPSIQSS